MCFSTLFCKVIGMPFATGLSPIFIPAPEFRFCGTAGNTISAACRPDLFRIYRGKSGTWPEGAVQRALERDEQLFCAVFR
jgi:hypothetical protein